jgi:hypothetical protein
MKVFVLIAATFLVALSFCLHTNAQAVSTVGRRLDEINKLSEKAARDAQTREMKGGQKPTKEELRRAVQIRGEIKEDLETLQAIYNDLITKLAARDNFSDGHAREVAAKIRKHAERLKTNIPFPRYESTDNVTTADTDRYELRQQIRLLCVAIHDLLTNPTIENIGLVDAERSKQARDSLDSIIEGASRLMHPGA